MEQDKAPANGENVGAAAEEEPPEAANAAAKGDGFPVALVKLSFAPATSGAAPDACRRLASCSRPGCRHARAHT